jgi:hypothetical protein
MCAEASTVLRAVAGDFFFNCWYLEILSDNRIRHIPTCVHYLAQGFRLETYFSPCENLTEATELLNWTKIRGLSPRTPQTLCVLCLHWSLQCVTRRQCVVASCLRVEWIRLTIQIEYVVTELCDNIIPPSTTYSYRRVFYFSDPN